MRRRDPNTPDMFRDCRQDLLTLRRQARDLRGGSFGIANVPVSERLRNELGASFDLVAVGNQAMKAKIAKPAGVTPEAFALVQEVLDDGEMIDEGREGKRTLYRKIGDTWFALVIAKSISGYLRVQTFYETSESVVRRRLGKHRTDPDSNVR